ncbi:MAG: DUF883 C-terminal domain-containing protein [Verrucomicrobiota bacterium]
MRNQAGDIAENQGADSTTVQEWKTKARAAGTAAWDATRATYEQIHDKTLEYTKATDRAIHERPYVAIGVALGVGVLLGYLVAGRPCTEEEEEA